MYNLDALRIADSRTTVLSPHRLEKGTALPGHDK